MWKLTGGVAVELWKVTAGAVNMAPSLSADGNWMAFAARQQGRNALYVAASDGTAARTLNDGLDLRSSPSWSPDGKWIAVAADTGEGSRIYKVAAGGGTPVRLTDQLAFGPAWSPDGQLILYFDASNGGTVFPVRAIHPDGQPATIPAFSQLGDFEGFRFAPDGKVIILAGPEGPVQANGRPYRMSDFWSVDLTTGQIRRLTELKPGYSVRSFDISPDGREILFDRVQDNSDIVLIDRRF